MTVAEKFPYEEEAEYNHNPPDGLDAANLCTYISLRNLYFLKRKGGIDDAAFDELRANIVRTHNQLNDSLGLITRCAGVWYRMEEAAIAFEKDKTIENAEAMYKAFYNLK